MLSNENSIFLTGWVTGDEPERVFSVIIETSATVALLKQKIKGYKEPDFQDVAPDTHTLFQVSEFYWRTLTPKN